MKQVSRPSRTRAGVSRRQWLSDALASCALGGVAVGIVARELALAHKFHFSTTLIELNAATQSFEVTVRLFADDLELVLGQRSGRKVEIDRAPDSDDLTFHYLREVLRLRGPDMQEIPLSWVGLEAKVDTVYCYLEAPAPSSGLHDLAVCHLAFFELQRGHTNIVTFRNQGAPKPHDLVFRPGDRFKVAIFPNEETDPA